MSILEIGPGLRRVFPDSQTIDHKQGDIDVSVELLPFVEEEFELVHAAHVLEHIYRPRVPFFFQQVYRVLRPSGTFQILTPNLRAAARAYVNDDFDWFRAARRHINIPLDRTIGEAFVTFLVSVGSDTQVVNRAGVVLGGLAHQWGWDYSQIEALGSTSGFRSCTKNYDEDKDWELRVNLIK